MRGRNLRSTPKLRKLVAETEILPRHLIQPIFVRTGSGVRYPIKSMPGQFQFSVDNAVQFASKCAESGIGGVMLFGIPDSKDEAASGAYDDNGIVQFAVKAIKKGVPGLPIFCDVCLCEYTSHGHCGIVKKDADGFEVDNDKTLPLLARTAVSLAKAGADFVCPSAMMDLQVRAIREGLDSAGYRNTGIMAYSAKYASAFYGPFRDAAESPPQFGDRAGYQMDFANSREALKEIEWDIQQGADIVMVKPAMLYLDIIAAARRKFKVPIAAYSVSGEYSAFEHAAKEKLIDRNRAIRELLTAIRRAGADMIITYWAGELAELKNDA